MALPDAASHGLPPPLNRGVAGPCSYTGCPATDTAACSYVDRRRRGCATAWCHDHRYFAFNASYCRRHVGVILALGVDRLDLALPDLDNRAPSLAAWVASDLEEPVRTLLQTGFPGQTMNVTSVVSGGSRRERSWGRYWKMISSQGIDCSVTLTVLEANDSVVRVAFDGKEVVNLMPPWIENRHQGVMTDVTTDREQRRGFYDCILEALEDAIMVAKQRRSHW